MAKSQTKPKQTRAPRLPIDRSNETKAQKFSRLASKRVTKALKAIKNVGNLAGSGYDKTPDQVKRINALLTETVAATVARFTATVEKKKDEVALVI